MSIDKHLALRERTKKFALRVLRMSQAIPHNREANIVSNQIVRSSTGMAANYRAAGLARSRAEFISQLGILLEEADETVFWLEMLAESGIIKPAKLAHFMTEANESVAIFATSRRTVKS